ncbi:MAG: BlaI/MecI/CopY family transcriptional regulator [Sphingobacteriales bacterium]|nr:BlaI/MecI/CopY family transcriptional regulator [Sphingobacteriales bacterium]OJW31842.1 MAG: transcriptional regulator [Sphingobacteriales bacterium 46-32]
MTKLAKREEQIMQAFWTAGKAFIREIIPHLPDPKPHYNSVATMVKILEEKGFLTHETVGNMHCYSPLISKEAYQDEAMKDILSQYFDNSYSKMLTYFTKSNKISEQELKDILRLIKRDAK